MFSDLACYILFLKCLPTKTVGVEGIELRPEAVSLNSQTEGQLYLHGKSSARHCMRPTRGRSVERVKCTSLDDVLEDHPRINCMKIDIEGNEIDILLNSTFPSRIVCWVFEYSYSVDPRMSTFKKVIKRLRESFVNVDFPRSALRRPKGADGKEKRYPDKDVIVHCWGRHVG